MKKLLFLGLMTCFTLAVNAQFTKGELHATGLTCAMCNNAINKALQELPFIQSVKSDIKNSSFQVQFKSGMEISPDAIKNAVEDAGFSVGKLILSGNAGGESVSQDQHLKIGNSVYHFVSVANQSLTPETRVMLVDRDFVSAKQYKKFSAATKMSCVLTGKAASCCTEAGIPASARIYHVTI